MNRLRAVGLIVAAVLLDAAGFGISTVAVTRVAAVTRPLGSALTFDAAARPLAGPRVRPESAWAMTAGPDDSIYVVDREREEVLRWSPGEGFSDVAGDGQAGFSGDSGAATKARFDFSWASAIAVGRDGTLYISDSGNSRIRAVGPDGVVETLVGGGRTPIAGSSLLGKDASLGDAPQLAGLAVGPNGELYVGAASGVYRLDNGLLIHVVGVTAKAYFRAHPGPLTYSDSYADTYPFRFAGATRLAFDGRGDLIVGSDDTYSATS